MRYVSEQSNWLDQPHFAIIEFDSIWIEGDERSKTNPGHGYPAHSESVVRYIAFTDEAEWKGEIAKRVNSTYGRKDNFKAVRVTPAKISTTVNVEIKE